MDRQDDIYRIIGKLESAIDLMQKNSSSCKTGRKAEILKVHDLLDKLKEELSDHKEKNNKNRKLDTKKIYIAWGLGIFSIICLAIVEKENQELMTLMSVILSWFNIRI